MILELMQLEARLILARGFLYKYKPLTQEGFSQVREIIRDSQIFFPRPSQLNDPEECKPRMAIGDINNPEYRPAVEAWVRRCLAHVVPPPSEARIQQELRQLTQDRLVSMLKEVDIQYRAAVEARYRILSLTDSPASEPLWQRYGDNFTGVCLQFAVNSRFGTAYEVQYYDGERAIDLTSIDDYEHLILTGLVKRTEWREEREYRLVFGEPAIDDQPPLQQQRHAFAPEHLTAVVVGYRANAKLRAKLLATARQRIPRLRCYEAWPAKSRRCTPKWRSARVVPLSIWVRYRAPHTSDDMGTVSGAPHKRRIEKG